jgi:hypothetical protein
MWTTKDHASKADAEDDNDFNGGIVDVTATFGYESGQWNLLDTSTK